jgi:starch synthase
MSNAAIYYSPDGFTTLRDDLMGRHAAGRGFLRGYARFGRAPVLYCFTPSRQHFEHFKTNIENDLPPRRSAEWIPFARCDLLSGPGCVFYPSPTIGPLAWLRRRFGARKFGICGITHTTASHAVMSGIGDLLVAPVQSWDAVVCTSTAVRRMVSNVLDGWSSYLQQRLGATDAAVRVQLPVIPLGVDCSWYSPSELSAERRYQFRQQHGMNESDVAVLFVGRLSFHAKANPLPMYLALEQAARQTGRRLVLIQVGWFANRAIESAFRSGAEIFCPSVRPIFVDGRQPEALRAAWAAADVFTSLSDNIQETFGLTPVEAMAAGLPVVVSDWDGYRDTVEDGVQGFRIPTTIPPPPLGEELAWRHAAGLDSYDLYVGHASQFTAVDVEACAAAYAKLASEPGLRRSMGEAGRRRARAQYDWSRIVAEYEALWDELDTRRQTDMEAPAAGSTEAANPLKDDPFRLFQSYASHLLDKQVTVALRRFDYRSFMTTVRSHPLASLSGPYLASEAECDAVLEYLAAHPDCPVSEVVEEVAQEGRRAVIHRSLAWLAKVGIVAVSRRRQP